MRGQGTDRLRTALRMVMGAWLCASLMTPSTEAADPVARTYTLNADFDVGML